MNSPTLATYRVLPALIFGVSLFTAARLRAGFRGFRKKVDASPHGLG